MDAGINGSNRARDTHALVSFDDGRRGGHASLFLRDAKGSGDGGGALKTVVTMRSCIATRLFVFLFVYDAGLSVSEMMRSVLTHGLCATRYSFECVDSV